MVSITKKSNGDEKINGVEDKTDIPRISSKTRITNCKPI